jgi:NAD dependent epimerase/dehydratase family enzyme
VAAISLLVQSEALSGPINLTAPQAVPNTEFTHELGRALRRPAKLFVPETVLRIVVGDEMTAEFLLASQRAVPERLLAAGFRFADPTLPEALVTALLDR